ncbi:MAG: PAS domain S-box protein [Gemmatimonadetes bacterium]|nr:MAG: PAS domain S-box protein [Gemmatimonadota bacterium]
MDPVSVSDHQRVPFMDQQIQTLQEQSQQAVGREKVDLLNQLAWEMRMAPSPAALETAEQAEQLARELDYPAGLCLSLRHQARYHLQFAHLEQAQALAEQALELAEMLGDLNEMGYIYNILGRIQGRYGNYPQALAYYLQSLHYFEQTGNQFAQANLLSNLGILHLNLGEYEKAFDYHLQSYHIKETLSDTEGMANSLLNMGSLHLKCNHYTDAIQCHTQALELMRHLQDREGEALVLSNLGEAYLQLGELEQARSVSEQGLALKREFGTPDDYTKHLLQLARIYQAQGEVHSAKVYLHKAEEQMQRIDSKPLKMYVHQRMYEMYRKWGEVEPALHHHEHYHHLYQELFNENTQKRRYEVELENLHRQIAEETHLRTLIENVPAAVWLVDTALKVVIFNANFRNFFQAFYGKDVIAGQPVLQAIPEDRAQEWRQYYQRALTGEHFFVEKAFELNQVHLEFEITFCPLLDVSGDITGISVFMQDISERKRAEQSLREREELLTSINRNLSEGIYRSTPDARLLYANQSFINMFGYSSFEELKTESSLFLYANPQRRHELAQRIAQEGRFENEEVEFIRKDGSHFWALVSSYGVFDKTGQVRYYDGAIKDITDRKLAEKALAEEKERLAVTLQSIGDAVITTDTHGHIVSLNPVAEELTGWQQEDAVGRDLNEVFLVINEQTGLPAENPVKKVLQEGWIMRLPQHTSLITREGQELPIADSAAPIRNQQGQIIGAVVVFRDVTDAQRLRRAKENFLNAISHELRTPLTPIIGYVQLLQEMDLPPNVKHILERILKSVEREKKLVDDLLAVARLESGNIQYHFTTQNAYMLFSQLAEEAHKLVTFSVKERYGQDESGFTYRIQIAEELRTVMVHVDVDCIRRVIENLVINAVKYSPPQRLLIEFEVILREERVVVAISDRGYGIPEDEIEAIFDPFYQIRTRDYDVSDGVGQGLAIVKQYVDAHQGTIWAESALGVGSRFLFELPVADYVQPRSSTTPLILLIEDDPETAEFIRTLLEAQEYTIQVAETGNTALEKLNTQTVDMVILDLQLPDMDGQTIISHMIETGCNIPLILCSAQPPEELARIQQKLPLVQDYISKPFHINEFTQKVTNIFPH